MIDKYRDVFPNELPKGLPPGRIKEDFRIDLQESRNLVKKGLYRMYHIELEESKKRVEKILEQIFIFPNTIPWESPVLFVSKNEGGLRFCIATEI